MAEQKIHCPKCNSTELTAQKHGFSAGKAIGGALVTGGIGLLAGLHGSTNIDITCLNCGHKWNPKTLNDQTKKEALAKQFADLKKWKSGIYTAYEQNKIEEAELIYLSKYNFNNSMPDIHSVYKHYKKTDRQLTLAAALFILVLAFVIYWLLK